MGWFLYYRDLRLERVKIKIQNALHNLFGTFFSRALAQYFRRLRLPFLFSYFSLYNYIYYVHFTLISNYIIHETHVITSRRWNNFQLFSLGEITENYLTFVPSIITVPFI